MAVADQTQPYRELDDNTRRALEQYTIDLRTLCPPSREYFHRRREFVGLVMALSAEGYPVDEHVTELYRSLFPVTHVKHDEVLTG